MNKQIINSLSLFSAIFGFCQWLGSLALLELVTQNRLGDYSLYLTIFFHYFPASFFPLLFKERLETKAHGKWLFSISSIGVCISMLLLINVYFKSITLGLCALFFLSSLVGICLSIFLTFASKLSQNIKELQTSQSRIIMGYYLGNLGATVSIFILGHNEKFIILTSIGVILQFLFLLILRGPLSAKINDLKLPVVKIDTLIPSLFESNNKVLGYLLLSSFRYFAWGIIAFYFPLVVIDKFSQSTRIFSAIAALTMGIMMVTSFVLSTFKKREGEMYSNYKVSAGITNILNGILMGLAYITPHFSLYLLCDILASIICIVADIKTSSSFIGNAPLHIRGRLSALTSSLRFLCMSLGNIFGFIFAKKFWMSGPILIAIFLCTAGLLCFWVLNTKEYKNEVSDKIMV